MKKEKEFLTLLITLIILILLLSIVVRKDKNNYAIKQDGKVFNISHKDDYTKIVVDNINFIFDFNNKVDLIYYFSDNNYTCVLPVSDNKINSEILCYDGKIYTYYHSIISKDKELDNYVETIKDYSLSKYTNDISVTDTINNVKFYISNVIDRNVSVTTYNGLINNRKAIKLFKKDVYNNELSTFINNYYFVVDYENKYTFDSVYIVNLDDNEVDKVKINYEVSLDSYIQGIVDDIIYLYDKDNEKQYKIDVKNKSFEEIVNGDRVKYYKNNKWTYISKVKANKVLLFDYNDLSNNFTDYDHVIKTDKYFYLFKKNNKKYDVYKVDTNHLDIIKYIFSTTTTNLICKDDYIYYIDKKYLYYYSDDAGLRTILYYNELGFNDTIKINIY